MPTIATYPPVELAPVELGSYEVELRRRLQAPQRHRLLQGYPMVSLMRPADGTDARAPFPIDTARGLIVGVLPHSFCNPTVQGCGFCTFPHERYSNRAARAVAAQVAIEIERRTAHEPALAGRRVEAVYFGGGTANLTPPDAFARLLRALEQAFDLTDAEISLEGVPSYFLARAAALLRALAEARPAGPRRISMGIQTFDPARLAAMGRARFGDQGVVQQVIARAHELGMTVSGDFLINLPGQTPEAMRRDIEIAVSAGLDQVCVYHLVLFPGLGSAWSRDAALLAARPSNETAFRNWREVVARLRAAGYVQTTLTNFERRDVAGGPRRFRYEECSFRPAHYDGIGFGPAAITCHVAGGRAGRKVINAASAAEYLRDLQERSDATRLGFDYAPVDLRLLHLTRSLARLRCDRATYRAVFGTDAVDDHAAAFAACERAGLLTITPAAIALTERGVFFADSVAGLLAWERARELSGPGPARPLPRALEAGSQFMG